MTWNEFSWTTLSWGGKEGTHKLISIHKMRANFLHLRCNIRLILLELDDLTRMEFEYRLHRNDSKLYKIVRSIMSNNFTKQKMKDLQHWFKHSMAILKNTKVEFEVVEFHNEFSKICTQLIDEYYRIHNNQITTEQLVQKLYSPRRIQYIIDKYGIENIDEY